MQKIDAQREIKKCTTTNLWFNCSFLRHRGSVIHPGLGISFPLADINSNPFGAPSICLEYAVATLSFIKEIDDPESTNMFFFHSQVTAALDLTAATTTLPSVRDLLLLGVLGLCDNEDSPITIIQLSIMIITIMAYVNEVHQNIIIFYSES